MPLRKLYVANVYDQDGTSPVGTLTTDRPRTGARSSRANPPSRNL